MCGIAGLFGQPDAASRVAEGLFAQQHRGQDSCGLASADGSLLFRHRGMGLVREVLTGEVLRSLPGTGAIGHVRYPTQGETAIRNSQPHLFFQGGAARFALASNGDITNLPALSEMIRSRGYELEGTNDAEVIAKAVGIWAFEDGLGLEGAIERWMREGRGAYSALLLTPDSLYAFRDPFGFRPLCLGELDGALAAASETVALDILRAKHAGEVAPGHIMRASLEGRSSWSAFPSGAKRQCVFEHIYFARPDSVIFSERVHEVRKRIGEALATGDDTEGDLVVPIPDSANFIGLAYANARKLPIAFGLVRNHYIGRTFIAPEQRMRDESVRLKFNPLPGIFEGKRVFLVDDSIVRGTTIKKLVRMFRENGAKEVHLRIGSPPIRHSCYYGIDTPEASQLVASGKDDLDVCRLLEADSLRYLPMEGLRASVSSPSDYCYACFTGDYPAGKKDIKATR